MTAGSPINKPLRIGGKGVSSTVPTDEQAFTFEADSDTWEPGSLDAAQLSGIIADARMPDLTGDVTTVEGAVATTIANDAVTYAKMQNVSATDRVLGRTTAGAGDVEEIATTGSGSVVRATSPSLVTPLLGTPTSGVMTNVTGLPTAGLLDDAVTYAKMQNISATARLLGRNTAGAGDTEEVTPTQATAMLDAATATLKGLVPTPPNNTTTFLRGDATFAAAGSGAVTRAGGNTTEGTTTSNAMADVVAITGLSIGATLPILGIVDIRKTTGAVATGNFRLELNTTTVGGNVGTIPSANNAHSGFIRVWIGPRVTNHQKAVMGQTSAYNLTDGSVTVTDVTEGSAGLAPTVDITDLAFQGSIGDAAVTLGYDEGHVYTLSAS